MNDIEFKQYLESEEGARIRPNVDRAISQAVNTYRENHPDPPADAALKAKDLEIERLKIDNQVIRECHRRGVDESFLTDLGVTFATMDEVGTKMELIGKRFEEMRTAKTNADLSNSFKPGGSELSPLENIKNMSPERIQFLENIGELDDLIDAQSQ